MFCTNDIVELILLHYMIFLLYLMDTVFRLFSIWFIYNLQMESWMKIVQYKCHVNQTKIFSVPILNVSALVPITTRTRAAMTVCVQIDLPGIFYFSLWKIPWLYVTCTLVNQSCHLLLLYGQFLFFPSLFIVSFSCIFNCPLSSVNFWISL